MKKEGKIDRPYLISVVLLTGLGFFIFSSASLGLLAREGATFTTVALKQGVGLILGILVFYCMSRFNYKKLKKYAPHIFIFAIFLNLLIFIPFLSFSHGGASRWINLRFITFQPSEFLKLAFIIYFGAWLSYIKDKISTFKFGILPYIIISGLLSILLLSQSDTDTLIVISLTGMAMIFCSGGRIRDIVILLSILAVIVGSVVYFRPYVRQRIITFLNPKQDNNISNYQIKQSLIAIGSGGSFGRGFGQSIQKFNYLPEPIGDSIFAVWAEEFGFIGGIFLVSLFLFFAFSSFKISIRSDDLFGGLIAIGIAILVLIESFMNISSMLGIIPLSGMPILFVSHGGTALIITLGSAGIIANISKHQKK